MKDYNLEIEDVYKKYNSSIDGLTTEEVEKRLNKYGKNILEEKHKKSNLTIFLSQFKDVMIIMLLLVAILSLIYAIYTNGDFIDSIVIFISVIVNAFMGFFQESKASKVVDSLKEYSDSLVSVKRDGKILEVDSKFLVPGDIIIIEAGDKITADGRIIDAMYAEVDESILTGESLTVEKSEDILEGNILIQDRKNMVFSGTNLVNGKIIAIVTNTAMDTEIGKIATTLEKSEEVITPLQLKVEKVSKLLTFIAAILVTFVLCLGIIRHDDVLSIVMLCISMVIASVPESLPIAITTTLTVGVKQMGKKKAVVKELKAIETLGATQVICSDKTGTLTTNKLTVVELFTNNKSFKNKPIKYKNNEMLINIMALCNNSELSKENIYCGDSVEVALCEYIKKIGEDKDTIEDEYERICEIPFDSDRKMMSTINIFNNNIYMFTKGSPNSILESSRYYVENGEVKRINKEFKEKIYQEEVQMSDRALKVLAFAYKKTNLKEDEDYLEDEKNLVFVGLVGLFDPPREDVKQAIKTCKSAHIRPIMITGDSINTAIAVAKEIGIVQSKDEAISGSELENLNDSELISAVKKYNVYARVTPDHKVRIVRALQADKKVVAMTGDGVNDAPAIKLAHVGIGMGNAGTDVTKNVADIILLDDSFSTIVTAVKEGRRIYNNVVSNIIYNLSSNFTEIIIIIIGMFLTESIILPLHVLYIDLVADTLPSIALAFESSDKNSMKKKPNGLNKKLFTPFNIASLSASVIIELLISVAIYFHFRNTLGVAIAQTLTLLSIVFQEFIYAYNCRSLKTQIIQKGIFSNKMMNLFIGILMIVQLIVFFSPVGIIFGLEKISIIQFLTVLVINLSGFFIIEVIKPILVKHFNDD